MNELHITAGGKQTIPIGNDFAPLQVRVTRQGRPVPDDTVTWQFDRSRLVAHENLGPSPLTTHTDTDGRSELHFRAWNLGMGDDPLGLGVGLVPVGVGAEGATEPVTFDLAITPYAEHLKAMKGDGQHVKQGEAFTPMTVQAENARTGPPAGLGVQFTVIRDEDRQMVDQAVEITDSSGQATTPPLVPYGDRPGTYSVWAMSGGPDGPLTARTVFHLTVEPA